MTRKRKRQQPGANTNWIQLAIEKKPVCAVPVSDKMFQADVPPILTGNRQDPDSSKWLGTKVWPPQESSHNNPTQDDKEDVIRKGRESCTCQSPGSVECVNLHVAEERNRLKAELGPAFEEWGFHHLGEGALSGWSKREENKFDEMMERKPGSGKVKVELLHQYFRNRDGKSIVNYFYNVYCPIKFARKTRAGCNEVDTDDDNNNDDDDEDGEDDEKDRYPSNIQTSKKGDGTATDNRSQLKNSESSESKKKASSKNKYMAGLR